MPIKLQEKYTYRFELKKGELQVNQRNLEEKKVHK